MSRIEEALRRARLPQLDEVAPVPDQEPAPPAHVAPRPYLVKDAGSDAIAVPEAAAPAPGPSASRPPRASIPEAAERERAKPEPDIRLDRIRQAPALGGSRSEMLILNPDMPQAVTEQYRKAAASL